MSERDKYLWLHDWTYPAQPLMGVCETNVGGNRQKIVRVPRQEIKKLNEIIISSGTKYHKYIIEFPLLVHGRY